MAGRRSRLREKSADGARALGNRELDNFDGEIVATEAVDEAGGTDHAELREDVGLHGWRGGGGEGENGNACGTVAQSGKVLADHAVVGAEIVAPLRDAMGLVDGDERGRTLGEHLRKARNAQPLGSDEKEVERASEIVDAGLARDGAVEAGVNSRDAQVECGELGDLVFHERDERRDDERRSAESDGGELIAERLPCPGGHHKQQVAAVYCCAADCLLVGAKLRKAKGRLQKLGKVFRIGRSGQNAADLIEAESVCFNFTET